MNKVYTIMEYKKTINDVEQIAAYMVAGCYLVNQKVDECGLNKFEVVYDFNLNGERNITPQFDSDGECINSVMVDNIFKTPRECKKFVEQLNDKLIREKIAKVSLFEARELAKQIKTDMDKAEQIQNAFLKSEKDIEKC